VGLGFRVYKEWVGAWVLWKEGNYKTLPAINESSLSVGNPAIGLYTR
jgi:hypothetical protein